MSLFLNTVSPVLHDYLRRLMCCPAFNQFYLAGGTALSLQLGHRKSIDIDLFTCQEYGTIDLKNITEALSGLFPITENLECLNKRQMVYTLFVGDTPSTIIKLDLCYDEQPIFPILNSEDVRMASDKEIAAMKLLAIVTGNRLKDYWDIYELKQTYSLEEMIGWALQRNPYTLTRKEILDSFNKVWEFPDPDDIISLKDYQWPFIADELYTEARNLTAES